MKSRVIVVGVVVASACSAPPSKDAREPMRRMTATEKARFDQWCIRSGDDYAACKFETKDDCEAFNTASGERRFGCRELPSRAERAAALELWRDDARCKVIDEVHAVASCDFETVEDCQEMNRELAPTLKRDCSSRHLATRATLTAKESTEREARNEANEKLNVCQAAINKDIREWRCWNDRELWRDLDIGVSDALDSLECLRQAASRFDDLKRCMAMAEQDDEQIVEKKSCLDAIGALDVTCGPLRLDAVARRVAIDLKVDETKHRLAEKAVSATERVQEKKAKAAAIEKRCRGTSALQLAVALRLDPTIKPSTVKGCTYSVTGSVETTTRDGWVIISWQSYGAAFKTHERFVDGAFLKASGARFIGVKPFERTDGGTANLAAFSLP